MKFAVVYGSVRSGRAGIKLAYFMRNKLQERGHDVSLIDPKEKVLPLLDKMYKEFDKGDAPEAMEEIHQILQESDGVVVVSAEYNHSVPPALKNILDHFQSEYLFKPGGIVTYSAGPFGGARVAPHLRAILGELGMVTPSVMFQVSKVDGSFADDGKAIDENYDRRVGRFLDEFIWYAEALKEKRGKGVPF